MPLLFVGLSLQRAMAAPHALILLTILLTNVQILEYGVLTITNSIIVCRAGRWMWLWRRCYEARRAISTLAPARPACRCLLLYLLPNLPVLRAPFRATPLPKELPAYEACAVDSFLDWAMLTAARETSLRDGFVMCRRDARRCCGGWWRS
jgi:hypothetical protein